MRISVFSYPHCKIGIFRRHLSNVARHAFEVAIPELKSVYVLRYNRTLLPVNRNKVRIASALARIKEILHPRPSARSTSNSRRAELNTEFLERLNLGYPAFSSEVNRKA